jgi:aldehyde dehydrogenase (NAD+)
MSASIVGIRRPYVDGKFLDGEGAPLAVVNPATEEVIAEVETCSESQVESAVLAARRSFDEGGWAASRPADRAAAIVAMADYFTKRTAELTATLRDEAGASAAMIQTAQLGLPLQHMRESAELYLSMPDYEPNPIPYDQLFAGGRVGSSIRRYEPVGVVSAISAYNYPFWINVWKVIPALLTGNSVVLRPSPFTPLSALVFGEAAEAVGLPAGVLNIVVEEGLLGARLMTTHPGVDQVTFTGSTTVGRDIMRQAADTVKRVMLELGGKSVQLYLPDAVDRAAIGCAQVFANHAGQACVAPTRMLVPEEHKADVVKRAAVIANTLKIGDPTDPTTQVGPLISAAQRDRCARYVAAAVEHGATVAAGGGRPAGLDRGYYFEPTVLDVPDNSNPAAQDEIFGPVLTVIGYRDIDHAVSIANDSIFGLAGNVIGADARLAISVAKRIRAGTVSVNGGGPGGGGAFASSGGYKQSGLGRERGPEGIRAFQQIKHLSVGTLS